MEESNLEKLNSNKKAKVGIIVSVIMILLGVGVLIYNFCVSNDKEEKKEEKEVVDNDAQTLQSHPYFYVVTAKYGATNEYKEFIDKTFGTNAEERFRVYFQWYNVVHELAHGLITYNSNISYVDRLVKSKQEGYLEEQLVNDFAVAYWKKYGDSDKLQMVKDTVDYILSNMKDPTDGKKTYLEYGKEIMSSSKEPTFEEYGWFQFSCVKAAFEKNLTLEEAYKNLGLVKEVKFDDEKLSYDKIDETVSDKVISDTVAKFKKWGLNIGEIYHAFDNDPNNNYSAPLSVTEYNSLKNSN